MASFDTVLIANRGEIALRVMRTCAGRGLRTVAVHTELDEAAPHVRAADRSVPIGSYLDVDEIVAAAQGAGAQAIHPGYGFLSERAAFAEAVTRAGLVFIGPTAAVIEQMGRKDVAREIAADAGVPVVPRVEAHAGRKLSVDELPVLVKAAAGGGGKGMRVVRAADELDDAVQAARRESLAAFGDDTLLIERFVERGRHIEVQVVGDQHGTVVHLGERDCSVQRRHQKVVEEAPAPTIPTAVRDRMTAAAVSLARAVGYVGAGTVEFLLDAATDDFYFLEMNTRLQVEHPVTEAVHPGLDLVALQLDVAAGERLDPGWSDAEAVGHAIEARIYAEDAYAGFLPQAGTADLVQWPADARVDQALESGQVVSTAYDPMLGKIIVHGADREQARAAMVAALDRTAILGLTTNTGFVRELVASPAFGTAAIETGTLDVSPPEPPSPAVARAVAAWSEARAAAAATGPWRGDGWRSAGPPAPTRIELDQVVLVEPDGQVGPHRVRLVESDGPQLVVDVDEDRLLATVHSDAVAVEVVIQGQRTVFDRPGAVTMAGATSDGTLTSPMPGAVVEVRVDVGDHVAAGAVLGTVEAMKMEHAIVAPFDGAVVEVAVSAGGQVALGDPLFVVEPA